MRTIQDMVTNPLTREHLEDSEATLSHTFKADRLNGCGNCGNSQVKDIEAECWTSVKYCEKCKAITYIMHQDRMGGVYYDVYEVWK